MVDILHINWRIIRIPSTVVRGLPCHHLNSNPKNWRNPKKHQGTCCYLAIFRGPILSMVTVGAYGGPCDPPSNSPSLFLRGVKAHQNFTRNSRKIFDMGHSHSVCQGPPRLSVLHPRIQLVFRVYWGDKSYLQLGICCPFTAGVEMMDPTGIFNELHTSKDDHRLNGHCFCKGLSLDIQTPPDKVFGPQKHT